MIDVGLAAGNKTLEHFQNRSLEVIRKGDDSPVTIADREAETLTRELLAARYPGDTIAGEEFAEQTGNNEYRWTVDPIDGTKSFICGVPLYSTLLAVEHAGRPLGGMILIPALGLAVVGAIGHGAFSCDSLMASENRLTPDWAAQPWTDARVSKRDQLSDAVFVTSEVGSFAERGEADAFERLQDACFLSRTWGDGYGYLMVATGRADLMVDPICKAWDVAAMLPILSESGGRFSDWKGVESVRSGEGVGSNGLLHDQIIELLGVKIESAAATENTPATQPSPGPEAGGLVVFLSGDLIFASRVRAACAAAGYEFQLSGGLPEATEKTVRYVIVDLSTRNGVVNGLMDRCGQDHPHAEVIAYAPHVQVERIRSARQHGLPNVLTRGQFNEQLPGIFKQ